MGYYVFSGGHGSQVWMTPGMPGYDASKDPDALSVTTSDGKYYNADTDANGNPIPGTNHAPPPPAAPPPSAAVTPAGLDQVDKDRAASRDLLASLLGQYNGYQNQAPPTAGYTNQGAVTTSAPVSWAPVTTATGTTAQGTTAQAGAPIQAAHVDPMSFGGPMSAGAASSGAAALAQAILAAPAQTYSGAVIDKTASDQMRARQLALADAITAAMNGQGPSVAQQQLQMGLEAGIAQQAALAAAARGQNVGLGQYQAAQNAGNLAAQTNAQAALLRAQEIATARGQLGAVLDSTRGADINLASNQANLFNQAGMFSAHEVNAGNQFNAGQQNQVGMFNAGQQNENQRLDAQLATNAAIASMQSGNQYNAQINALAQALAIQNGQWQQDTALNNANLAQQLAMFNTGQTNQLAMFNTGQTNQLNQFNAGQTNSYNQALAQALQQNNQFNTAQTNAWNTNQASLNQNVNLANLNAALQTNQLNQQGKNALLASLLTGQGQLLGADTSIYGSENQSATAIALAQMNAELQKYLQQQQIKSQTDINDRDWFNFATNILGMGLQSGLSGGGLLGGGSVGGGGGSGGSGGGAASSAAGLVTYV